MLKTNSCKEKAKPQQLTGDMASGDEANDSDSDGEPAGIMWKNVSNAILKTIKDLANLK